MRRWARGWTGWVVPDGPENLGMVIRYLLQVGDRETRSAAGRVLHSVMDAQRAEELMKTYGERLIAWGHRKGLREGLQQGLQQGRLQARAETILRILYARRVWVGEPARQRILSCTDGELLDRWLERALEATTLSQVLDDPAQ